MDTITIDGIQFRAFAIPSQHSTVLLILGSRGMIGCSYFNVETAERLGDALAVVSGVKTCDDMLVATVKKVSSAAASLGVEPGMTGREALLRMQ